MKNFAVSIRKKTSFLFFFSCFFFFASADSRQINAAEKHSPMTDSLLRVLKTVKQDTNKINALNLLSRQYSNAGLYEQAIYYAEQAQADAEKIDFKKGLGNAYSNMGIAYWHQGVSEKALKNHLRALIIRKEIEDLQGVAGSYNNIGLVYLDESNYEKTLENYFKSLKIKEEIGDKRGIANSYNNIGVIYLKQNNYTKALDVFIKSLKFCEEIGDKHGIAMAYGNIGLVYFYQNDFKKALDNQLKGLQLREQIGDKQGMTLSLTNIGNIYINQNDYRMALEIYFQGLKIDKEIGNAHGISVSDNNIGTCYMQLGEFDKSLQYLNDALRLCTQTGEKGQLGDVYSALSDLYEKKSNFKKAFEYQKLYADIKDTILSTDANKHLTEMNTKYESEKKDKELIRKDAEIIKQQAETEKQNFERNAFIAGSALLLLLVFFIFRGYRQKQLANKLLDEKNEKITDSINYAKGIQESILPPIEEINKYLPESFVFYQPKDIVSGDFYWFCPLTALPEGEERLLLAAVDCTGHGVPGAFMSMLGYNLLEQVVKKNHISEPAKILDELSKLVAESLRQTNEMGQINNGMDIALVSLMFNNQNGKPETEKADTAYCLLEYAGAHNSLYIIRNGILQEIKADKSSISLLMNKSFCFKNHKITLEKGDCCYIFSDGYADQSGGPDNEKFYYQPFRELLTAISTLPMKAQQERLKTTLSDWKGSKGQVDDILVIGFRV